MYLTTQFLLVIRFFIAVLLSLPSSGLFDHFSLFKLYFGLFAVLLSAWFAQVMKVPCGTCRRVGTSLQPHGGAVQALHWIPPAWLDVSPRLFCDVWSDWRGHSLSCWADAFLVLVQRDQAFLGLLRLCVSTGVSGLQPLSPKPVTYETGRKLKRLAGVSPPLPSPEAPRLVCLLLSTFQNLLRLVFHTVCGVFNCACGRNRENTSTPCSWEYWFGVF